jgi:hypothetical protein
VGASAEWMLGDPGRQFKQIDQCCQGKDTVVFSVGTSWLGIRAGIGGI